jgi:hypothetical protein
MDFLIKHPLIVLALSFFLLWLSAKIGLFVRKRQLKLQKDVHQDLDIIVSATLTLLGLGLSGMMGTNFVGQPGDVHQAARVARDQHVGHAHTAELGRVSSRAKIAHFNSWPGAKNFTLNLCRGDV